MIRFNNSQKNGGFLLKIFHVHTHMTKMLRHDLARAFEMDFVLEHNTLINTSYSFIFNIISMFSLDTIGIFVLKINTRNKSSQENLCLSHCYMMIIIIIWRHAVYPWNKLWTFSYTVTITTKKIYTNFRKVVSWWPRIPIKEKFHITAIQRNENENS